jgi:hypothetical protein
VKRLILLACIALAAATAAGAHAARADSTPVGPLPKGPVTTVGAKRGTLLAVALPRQQPSTGLVWRIARRLDARVIRQVSEADVGTSVVVVFKLVGHGRATVRFALTRGDASPKAVRSSTYRVTAA